MRRSAPVIRSHVLAVGAALVLCLRIATAATNGSVIEIRDTLHGHFVYKKNCAVCHGRRGDGKGEMGLTVKPLPRDFGSGLFKYRSTPPGALPTDDDLARTIRHGIPDTAMPIFSALPERDVRAVIEYLKTFSPRWREAKNYAPPMVIPERPGWFGDMAQVRRRGDLARSFYATACAPCHGEKGDGLGVVTNLVDSWGHPAPARDLRLPYLRSGKRPEDIYRVLMTGIDGTPMPSFAEGTTEEQRWNLVAFIEQLRRAHLPGD
jgi:mono/diheme cytochrome c family protein